MRERERPERLHRGSPHQCGGARLLGITKHHQKFRRHGGVRNHRTALTEPAVWDSALFPSFTLTRVGRNAQLLHSAAARNPTRKAMDSWSHQKNATTTASSRRGRSDPMSHERTPRRGVSIATTSRTPPLGVFCSKEMPESQRRNQHGNSSPSASNSTTKDCRKSFQAQAQGCQTHCPPPHTLIH